jgi:NADPH-dependent glutamate synthase beta subunit-like oxidoreductase
MPAIREEVEDAEAEGAEYMLFAAPKSVLRADDGKVRGIEVVKMVPGEFDRSGRRRPVATDQTSVVECDTVIVAIGERPDADHLRRACITVRKDGTVDADWLSCKTDRPHVHAGGDLVSGASNVSTAMGAGKRAARAIDQLLMREDRFPRLLKTFSYGAEVAVEPQGGPRNAATHLAASKRRNCFKEVMQGFSPKKAEAESIRCLRCDVKEESH